MPRTVATPTRVAGRQELLDAYWRAANYLSVGQIYLLDNPLLREPLQAEHVKPRALFRQFSFPCGIPSHVAPETPGSIHEGGELGYSLVHAYGAAFDNPDLLVLCVVGDGEAETGSLAASWQSNKAGMVVGYLALIEIGGRVFYGATSHALPGRPHQRRHRYLRRRIAYFSTASRPPGRSFSSR